MSEPKLIIIHETVVESVTSAVSSIVAVVAMIGIGVWLESVALQWIGALFAILAIFQRASGRMKRSTMTVSQARKRLDEIEAGR